MSDAYSKELRKLAMAVSSDLGYSNFMREGVYCMVSGPNFETIAEARMLHILGSDSVGKSPHGCHANSRTSEEAITNSCDSDYFHFSMSDSSVDDVPSLVPMTQSD